MPADSDPSWLESVVESPAFLVLAGIATIIGIVWAMLVIARAVITKPRVRLEYDKLAEQAGHDHLICNFYNDPITGWPLSALNVKRQNIESLTCLASIFTADGRRYCDLDSSVHDWRGHRAVELPLPSSMFSLFVPILLFEDDTAWAFLEDAGGRVYVGPGTYECRILIHADEVDVRVVSRQFVVRVDGFDWVGAPRNLPTGRLVPYIRGLLRRQVS